MGRVSFRDNIFAAQYKGEPGLVEVERIYLLDWDAFAKAHWSMLEDIYRKLPGTHRSSGGPMWFGSEEESPPFLWASVEPPGLQVYGVVDAQSWNSWDEAFRKELAQSKLPFREWHE